MDCSRGFSLVEAMCVAAVMAVLFSVGAPSLGGFVDASRVTSASNELLGDLLLTRSEALMRRQRVVLCKSADGATCAAAGGWQQGWIVFADANGDGRRQPAETLLRVRAAVGGSLRVTGTSPVASYVSYVPSGATKLVGGGFQAGTLTVCAASAGKAPGRQIIVNSSGRPRTQKVQLASCA